MKKLLFITTFIAFCMSAYAEEDVIIVSAAKIEQTLEESVEKVQVLSEEDLKKSGAKNLTEAMKTLPGVTIKTSSPGNPVDSISMQGFTSSYVKILVNGIEVSGDISGSPVINSIPLEDVDHIEVIEGASSSLYGSDAMGGVINIITKKSVPQDEGTDWSADLTQEATLSIYGDKRSYTALQTKVTGENLSLGLTGSYDYTPGLQKTAQDVLAGKVDYYETPQKTLAYVKGNLDFNDYWGSAGIFGLYNTSDQISNYSPVSFDTSSTMEYDTKRLEGGLTADVSLSDDLSVSGFSCIKGFSLFTEQNVKTLENPVTKDENTESSEWENEIRASYSINDANRLLTGLHGNLETIEGDSFSGVKKQLLLSAYAQDSVNLNDDTLSIVFGGRLDFAPSVDDSNAFCMVTPKLSTKIKLTDADVLRLSYGMGYKTPSLKQKYWVFRHSYSQGEGNFILTGNPDLKSEKSQGFNARYEKNILNLVKADTGAYFNYVDDMISSVVTDASSVPQKRTYVNINTAITYGGDISLSSKLDKLDLRLSYAYTDAKKREDGSWKDLTLRVNHRVCTQTSYQFDGTGIKVSFDTEWNSPQLIAEENSKKTYTPDYLMVSAYMGRTFFDEKLELYLRGNNLLNNWSFIKGSDGSDMKTYYGLNAGTALTVGGKIKL